MAIYAKIVNFSFNKLHVCVDRTQHLDIQLCANGYCVIIIDRIIIKLHIRIYHIISRAFRETIRMTFGVCVCVCVCVCVQGISPSITGRILKKLRMDIPVHHAQCV